MRRAAVVVLSLLLLTGCSDDGEQRPQGSSGSASSSSAPASADPSERLLDEDDDVEPLATAEGDLPLLGTTSRVRVDVLEVRAGDRSTLLRWRLASTSVEAVDTYTSSLSYPLGFDTRQVALLGEQERLQPFTFVPQQDVNGQALGCVCSGMPPEVGPEGALLTALYPPLADDAEQVDVELPGVATLTGVPVSR